MSEVKVFSKSSRNARIYKWFYRLFDEELPTRSCVYYSKSMLIYIMVLPYLIFTAPTFLIDLFFPKNKRINHYSYKLSDIILYSIILNFVLFILFELLLGISLLFINYSTEKDPILLPLAAFGVFIWCILIVIVLFYYMDKLVRKFENRPKKHPKPNVFIEYIKQIYEKNCSFIEWK